MIIIIITSKTRGNSTGRKKLAFYSINVLLSAARDNLFVLSRAYYLPFLVALVYHTLNRNDISRITWYLIFLRCVNRGFFSYNIPLLFISSHLCRCRLLSLSSFFFFFFLLLFLSKLCSVSAHPFSNNSKPFFLRGHGLSQQLRKKKWSSHYLLRLNFEI